MTKRINAGYARKLQVAAEMADAAWLRGGLDAMQDELASLRRLDADGAIIAQFEGLYHRQVKRTTARQEW